MAKNKLSLDQDLSLGVKKNTQPKNVEQFISGNTGDSNQNTTEKPQKKHKKNLGGRPKKEGLKNEQFTLTMHPEMYEKLKLVATDYTRGNFSALIDAAIKVYCKEMHIDLTSIKVEESKLDIYRKKQEKKAKKK